MRELLYPWFRVVALCAVLPCVGLSAPALAQDTPGPRASAPLEGVVNINQATAEQLRLLPGIGPARAQAIVDYRRTSGGFERIEDLLDVSGIGERALERLRPYVVLEGKTTAVARPN